MTDYTPRQVILAFLGGEPADLQVLRSAVARMYYGFENVFMIDEHVKAKLRRDEKLSTMSLELLAQQSIFDDYICGTEASVALPNLCRSRRTSPTPFARTART